MAETDTTPEPEQTTAMVSLAPSTAASTLATIKAMPEILSDDEFAMVRAIAKADLPSPAGMGERAFGEAMKLLDTLPRRKDDTDTGEVRFRVYRRCLSHLSAPQMWWTVEEAIKTCKFCPSVKELLDIAEGWQRSDEAVLAQREARSRAAREARRRQIEASRKPPPPPMTQADVDGMDETLIAIGLKCGALVEVEGKVVLAPEDEAA